MPRNPQLNTMLRIDRRYADYLRTRAKREGRTVCALTRKMHARLVRLNRKGDQKGGRR